MGLMRAAPRILAAGAAGQARSMPFRRAGPRPAASTNQNHIAKLPPGVGVVGASPHVYKARVGWWDMDHGHMNQAAYLTHAERARLEFARGLQQPSSFLQQNNVTLVDVSNTIRYVHEIRPFFRKFHIETQITALDERHIWTHHAFRYPPGEEDDRIRAQVLIKASIMERNQVWDPRLFLHNKCGIPQGIIDQLDRTIKDRSMQEELLRYEALERALGGIAESNDKQLNGMK